MVISTISIAYSTPGRMLAVDRIYEKYRDFDGAIRDTVGELFGLVFLGVSLSPSAQSRRLDHLGLRPPILSPVLSPVAPLVESGVCRVYAITRHFRVMRGESLTPIGLTQLTFTERLFNHKVTKHTKKTFVIFAGHVQSQKGGASCSDRGSKPRSTGWQAHLRG